MRVPAQQLEGCYRIRQADDDRRERNSPACEVVTKWFGRGNGVGASGGLEQQQNGRCLQSKLQTKRPISRTQCILYNGLYAPT